MIILKVLVTGANGYLGQGIVKKMLDNGHQVIAADIKMDHVDKRAERFECDFSEIEEPFDYFSNPDVLLHLAWRDGFIHYSDTHIKDIYAHYLFLKKMMESGIHRIAVMGSMHEVGFHEGSINENTPCHPLSLYGAAKDALRNIAYILASQNKTILQWLRGYYIVGNSEYGCSIFSKIADAERSGKKEFPFTSGQNQYDFMDYNDFVYKVACAIEQEKVTGIINICSGKPEKLADRVERFINENKYSIILKYGTFPDRPYDSKAVWGDNSKIEKIMSNQHNN